MSNTSDAETVRSTGRNYRRCSRFFAICAWTAPVLFVVYFALLYEPALYKLPPEYVDVPRDEIPEEIIEACRNRCGLMMASLAMFTMCFWGYWMFFALLCCVLAFNSASPPNRYDLCYLFGPLLLGLAVGLMRVASPYVAAYMNFVGEFWIGVV